MVWYKLFCWIQSKNKKLMAIVTNIKTLALKILVKHEEDFEKFGIFPEFLDYCVKPAFNAGRKYKRYWLIKTDAVVRTEIPPDRSYAEYYRIMRHANELGFSMIQIIRKDAKHNS